MSCLYPNALSRSCTCASNSAVGTNTGLKNDIYIYIYIYIVGFICKPLKEYKLVNLIIVVDQNNQGMILIHRKYEIYEKLIIMEI